MRYIIFLFFVLFPIVFPNISFAEEKAPPAPPCAVAITSQGCEKVASAFGDFGTSPDIFVSKIFTLLLSISGGMAVLLFMTSGYRMITSQGNPEGIKNSQEMLISAIVGLIFVIFSYMLLGFIGKDILNIPGF